MTDARERMAEGGRKGGRTRRAKTAARDLLIQELRRKRWTYTRIGQHLGVPASAVRYVCRRDCPSLLSYRKRFYMVLGWQTKQTEWADLLNDDGDGDRHAGPCEIF